MRTVNCLLAAGLTLGAAALNAKDAFREAPEKYWDFAKLQTAPAFRDAPFEDSKVPGLRAVLVTGYGPAAGDKSFSAPDPKPLSAKEKAEFFAYIGFPEGPVPEGGFPGIVLIHGGGGTAFPQYARLWVSKGYAVIILDWYNQRPVPPANPRETNVKRVPLPGGKRQDHVSNVANMILAHSLLRSLKNVNPEKTAFVGLSWGSWYGAMVASLDTRFKGGVEIYCGDVKKGSPKHGKAFINGRFHHAAKIPLYWVAGTNDQNVTLASLDAGFQECPKVENKSLVVRLPHSHIGFSFPSCFRMAAHFTQGGPGLPKLSDIDWNGNQVKARILDPGKGVRKAILCYTDSTEKVYHKRVWKSVAAKIEKDAVSAELPEGAHQFFLSAYDEDSRFNDLCGSTSPVILPFPKNQK